MGIRIFSVLFSAVFFAALNARAQDSLATFRNATAISGRCVENLAQPAEAVLSAKGIRVKNGTFMGSKQVASTGGSNPNLQENVARIVQRIDSLTGGVGLPAVNGMTVWNIPNLDILARQTGQGLTMRSDSINNVANIAHELGHKVGNSTSSKAPYSWYGLYKANVPPCQFTHYCKAAGTHPRQEEFAEVFAAYLTHPQMLLSGGANCQAAFAFLRENMFKAKDTQCANGNPISVVRVNPPRRNGPLDPPNPDAEDCPPENDPIARDRRNVQQLISTTNTYAHVADHDVEDRTEEEIKAEKKRNQQESQQIQRGFATIVSFAPAALSIYMQNKAVQDQAQQQINLMNNSYYSTGYTSTSTGYVPSSAIQTAPPTGVLQRSPQLTAPTPGTPNTRLINDSPVLLAPKDGAPSK